MKPASLFHYARFDIAELIICDLQLKLSYYPRINDPFALDNDITYDPKDKDGSKDLLEFQA